MTRILKNFINGQWCDSKESKVRDVLNPATGECLAKVPAGSKEDIDDAAESAHQAWWSWRNKPPTQRVQYLFKMKQILEKNSDEIAEICTSECGKTFAESKGELARAIENIEVACGIPTLLQSDFSEDIAVGVDEYYIRQPLGVGASISPFNFPVMIPFWFMPYAIACGNTYIIKPSGKVPRTMNRVFELFEELNLPAGVLNMVHGGKATVDAILEHPYIKAVSFVGSTPIAKYIYKTGTAHGKRVQALGGAKNPVVIMPDADVDATVKIITDSAYGCAGQRCLAVAIILTVGKAGEIFTEKIIKASKSKKIGNGMTNGVEIGPVITMESKERIEKLIQKGIDDGAKLLLDGRNIKVPGCEDGNFIGPTILGSVDIESELYKTEIFGPVIIINNVDSLDDAIKLTNDSVHGNAASIFTTSGAAARKFRHDAQAGNIGVNIGIAAPMAFFPFSGWKESFFGDLHGQSFHAVEFYTQTKVVIERWHDEWTRKF
ncbi:MAG: CoA-acylating methylmalonate-semialdehyde dehydrogenase [Bacteroidales bacterium]|jgi:malonate-semialdehyde dehydrogenase (acetylating)/methylmalonate-semialdehyde dehydrogenase|nr:CoA-acylating methylmalonate-semialdehyde dehydrogenase [Bacteroidales bacterium]